MNAFPPLDPARSARILAWADADPELQGRFRQQLGRHTGWARERCDRAIREYLRFCAVAARLRGRAVPSPEVDAVWHLHLTWTRDYWDHFCPQRLGMALHHQPSRGRPGEREALRAAYADTLHAYAEEFGSPAPAAWPAAWAPAHRPRGRSLRFAVALGLLPAAALAYPGPLDWRGAEFLGLYLALLAAALGFALLWRLAHRRASPPARSPLPGTPSLWQLAYLRGGATAVIDTAVAQLHELGLLEWDATHKGPRRVGEGRPEDPILRELLPTLGAGPDGLKRAERLPVLRTLHDSLVRQGWWHEGAQARRIAAWSALPLWLLAGFGLAKVAIGLSRDRPVALLVVLIVVTLVAALWLHFHRPGTTRAGREALRAQRARHALSVRAPRRGELGLAVALMGTAVLSGTALAGYHTLRQPSSSADGGSSDSSDGGSSDGGSGCGGCGGD